jgi:hypothetical protein
MIEAKNWLSNPNHFEIFKIILDKGLLALILAFAGLGISYLLERYKSILKRQEAIVALVTPKILEMITRSDSLFQSGIYALKLLDKEFAGFVLWRDALWNSQVSVKSPTSAWHFSRTPENLKELLEHKEWGPITFEELLKRTAPTEFIREMLNQPDFFSMKSHYESTGFISMLKDLVNNHWDRGSSLYRATLLQGMALSAFVPITPQPREAYRKDVREFRLAMIRDVPCRTRKHAKAFDSINKELDDNVDFIDNHPTGEILQLNAGAEPFSSRKALADAHAVIVTRLRTILETA